MTSKEIKADNILQKEISSHTVLLLDFIYFIITSTLMS